jgi:hypothetical protein
MIYVFGLRVLDYFESGVAQTHKGIRDLEGVKQALKVKPGAKGYQKLLEANFNLAEHSDDIQRYMLYQWGMDSSKKAIEKENEDFIKEAQTDFINGFLKAQETTKDDIHSVKQKVDTFKQKINSFDLEAVEKIEEVESALYLNLHSNWLTNFNNKFAGNYA